MNTRDLILRALNDREALIEKLHAENTNAYRLFHGVAEGLPGLTIDRYGPLVLAQTFREPMSGEDLQALEGILRELLPHPFAFACNHRGRVPPEPPYAAAPEALREFQCREFGVELLTRARHSGQDPWLFLDLRAGRRALRRICKGAGVLNLFSYTGSVGVTAASAGALEVWNVDFASSSLEVARRNAALNRIPPDRFKTIQEDCVPVMRQLAGLSAGGRRARAAKYQRFEARQFDVVFLDPPAWSKGAFGAVDVEGDYPSLFKAAVLAAKPGGHVIATNHVAAVELESWVEILKRCATKAGRPTRAIEVVPPEADFPSFDGRHPLKIAICEV